MLARAAHHLASQVLAIHHQTLADELRALERAATQEQWPEAEAILLRVEAQVDELARQIERQALTYDGKN